ncbi:hypothetical protein [Bradyrhizobium archetypum]|uniref:Uncharacterized protein n=1 Tax=Bradyrhizobium archetypum TaxID=2721160 RepID=A0A7Y4M3D9_9BRAD|nr:hypothetical protein [Bradyrhizobium archetypum]NOJ47940.1 hypothetical protein [Bradyrhizobium archetypum]
MAGRAIGNDENPAERPVSRALQPGCVRDQIINSCATLWMEIWCGFKRIPLRLR